MKKILFLLASLCSYMGNAQPPERFYTTFGGDGDDIAYSAKQTLDNDNYIIVGSSSSYGSHGNTDLFLLKLNTMGVFMWQKFIGGTGNDIGKAIIQLPDSSLVIAGYTNSFGAGGYDAYLVKTDKNGEVIWETTFGGTDWEFANDLVLASDGNIVMVGNTSSFGNGKKDGFVVKYDQAGNLLWQKFIGGVENEELRSVIKTNDNFIATVGYTESKNEINGDGYFLKMDLNGDTLFTKTFGGPYKDYANDLVQKNDDHYVICGARTYSANAKTQSYMYNMNPNGTLDWENHYYASSDDEDFVSVSNSFQMSNLNAFIRNVPVNGYKMQGNIFVAVPGGYNYKVNSFGGIEDEDFFSVEATSDGGFLVVGSTLSFNSKAKDVFIMKHDSTCFNYISTVSMKENQELKGPVIYYENDHVAKVNFTPGTNPEAVFLFDLNGKMLRKFDATENDVTIDLSGFPNSVYLVKISFKDGHYYHGKLVNR